MKRTPGDAASDTWGADCDRSTTTSLRWTGSTAWGSRSTSSRPRSLAAAAPRSPCSCAHTLVTKRRPVSSWRSIRGAWMSFVCGRPKPSGGVL
eukprot:2649205-Rhodomonas_salina.2